MLKGFSLIFYKYNCIKYLYLTQIVSITRQIEVKATGEGVFPGETFLCFFRIQCKHLN